MVFIKTIQDEEGANFSCEQCHYKARRKDLLLRHIKSIHQGVALKSQ